uniref:Uncharacterized protein n=1 Tax=Oryza rufipogon TaxID=4529 RepID=A0A0E0Q9L2_ORYRU
MDSNNVEYCVALNRLSSLWNLLDALHKIACVDFASTYLSLIKEANHIILGSWSYSQALALIFYGSNFVLNRARAYCRKESAHACPNHCTPSQEKQVDQKFSLKICPKKFIFTVSPITLVANHQT